MNARYAPHSPRKSRQGRQPKRGFFRALWLFLFGFTAGLGTAAGVTYYVNNLPIPFAASPTQDPGSAPKQARNRSRRDALEFHNILKGDKAAPAAEDTPAAARQFVYYLQMGAFAARDAAESLRATLALGGRPAAIKIGAAADGGEVYRVWMGPMAGAEEAESLRAQLALEGYNGVSLLKIAESSESQ